MISYHNVRKEYPDGTVALENVSLEIADGEFVFIIGPSGAGKSTLFKLLNREELPTEGEIYLDDLIVSTLKDKHVPHLRRTIGMVFQDFKLLPSLTVVENVAYPLQVIGKSRADINEIVPEVLSLVGLMGKEKSFPRQLSGGERQKLAIARALSTEPKVLVADEPTGNVDYGATWVIMELLEKINEMGTTVMMSTHDPEIVDRLKRRTVILENGTIVSDTKGKKR